MASSAMYLAQLYAGGGMASCDGQWKFLIHGKLFGLYMSCMIIVAHIYGVAGCAMLARKAKTTAVSEINCH